MVNIPNLRIPDVIDPDKTRCICLQIPDNETWISNFVGLLQQPGYWFNWQRTGDNSGSQCADVWQLLFDQIDWSTMSCCCDNPPAIFRYNDSGVYQRSTDGGLTWVDAPEYDYRNISTVFPPPSTLGFDNTKCTNADSAVVILNEDVIQGLDNGSAVQAILEFIAAVLIFYLSAGTLATISIGLFAMAAAIFGYGVAATKAAFTSTVLDQLRCTIYCNMATDDSVDAAGFARILTDINDHYTGIVKTSLYAIISAAGVVGMTNMIRSNRGSATADCSGCVCPEFCPDGWHPYESIDDRYGTIVSQVGGVYTFASGAPIGGTYYIYIHRHDMADCCYWQNGIFSAGAPSGGVAVVECGHTEFDLHLTVAGEGCVWVWQAQNNAPFTVQITFTECP